MKRICCKCGKDLGKVGGFTLVRDVLKLIHGIPINTARELCNKCAYLIEQGTESFPEMTEEEPTLLESLKTA